MSKRLPASVAVLVLLAACGVQQSSIDASSSVTISGKALGPDGHPLANAKIVLVKELDLGEVIGGLFLTAASLGLACLADHPPAICANNSRTTTTDGGGSYSFSVKGRDTQGSFGVASTMEVMTRVPAAAHEINAPVAFAEFNVQTASLTLPDLHVWQPTVTPAGETQPSHWPPLPSSYGTSPAYALEFTDLQGHPWWVTGPTTSGKWVDWRVLEDMNGAVDVAAHAHGTASGTTIDFTYISGSVAVRGTAGEPPSRGDFCAPVTKNGVGSLSASCYLTSGDLSGAAPAAFAEATGAVIDLGQGTATISLVVVRGCPGQCKLAVSSDESTWTDAGSVAGRYATAPMKLKSPVRYVRIMGSPAELRQVSIW